MSIILKLKRVIFFIVILGCYTNGSAVKAKAADKAPTVSVETVVVKFTPKSEQIVSTGNLIAIPGIIVKPEVGGRITNIYFTSGDVVEQGTALVEINPDIIQAELVAAQAELKVNRLNFERSFSLYQTHDISKSDFDRAQANYNSAKANVDSTRAQLRQTAIVAPFPGKLGLSKVSVGDYVTAGQSIVTLQTVDPLKVDFSVPEVYQSKIKVGQTVILRTDAYPQETFSGQVEAIESLINQNNRTLNIRANVPNKNGKLVPGGFVTVTVLLSERQAVAIPQTSIVYDPDGSYVYKVVEGKARKTKVVLGEKDSDNVIVTAGLALGDVVVTAGQLKIYPGAQVIVAS